ncbi:MAG: two-component system LytT family response regulator [Arenicella sp.]|jgi:two-component system LytT family response regulator
MKYKCVIVDDEELARELIETHLSQLDEFELVASCESALEAQKILRTESVDLLFLDIEMPVLKGTDFLKSLTIQPKVIFTTAYRDYAIEGFELNAIDYLLKPIVFERFFKAVSKFLESSYENTHAETPPESKDYIYVQSKRKNIRINLSEVLYIESVKDYVRIHLKTEDITFKSSITSFYEKLDTHFLRIHRSFIVNTRQVTAFTKNDVEIGQQEIPIGEMYKEEVLRRLN